MQVRARPHKHNTHTTLTLKKNTRTSRMGNIKNMHSRCARYALHRELGAAICQVGGAQADRRRLYNMKYCASCPRVARMSLAAMHCSQTRKCVLHFHMYCTVQYNFIQVGVQTTHRFDVIATRAFSASARASADLFEQRSAPRRRRQAAQDEVKCESRGCESCARSLVRVWLLQGTST